MGALVGGSRAAIEGSQEISGEVATAVEKQTFYPQPVQWDFVQSSRTLKGSGLSSEWNVVYKANSAGKAYFLVPVSD